MRRHRTKAKSSGNARSLTSLLREATLGGGGGGTGRAGAGEGQHKEAAARQVGEGWVEADLDVIESV